jgi:Spy/CpxP family protein refolding chaperone
MSRESRSVFRRAWLAAALAVTTSAFAVPAATAAGPPQGGGGCHMVTNSGASDLEHMMTGSANGEGGGNMGDMLSRFSCA